MTKKKLRKEAVPNRNAEALRKARTLEDANKPINQFLNLFDENNKLKYSMAKTLREYFFAQPELVTNNIRLINSLVHEIKFHNVQADKYLKQFKSDGKVTVVNKNGELMTKEECYSSYLIEKHVPYIVLNKLRATLTEALLSKIDNENFTYEQYNDYLENINKVIKDMGYELFPNKVEVVYPL